MGAKGDTCKQNIASAAKKLFAKKGFCKITMQDICRETGLSRGGLYRHFSSTADIFKFIIEEEQKSALKALEDAKANSFPAYLVLNGFIRSRISSLLDAESSIDNAIGEYAANSPEGMDILKKRAENSIIIVENLIKIAQKQGNLICSAPRATAENILWTLEGMSKHNAILPISNEEIQRHILFFYDILGFTPETKKRLHKQA